LTEVPEEEPVSWVIANGVVEGRSVLNFSEWATYSPVQQQTLLAASCQTAMDGTMPGSAWTLLRPETRLSHKTSRRFASRPARPVEGRLRHDHNDSRREGE
jgi:hypothetical protein